MNEARSEVPLSEREQRRLACVCGHPLIRHSEYGCWDCGTAEASTPQHSFTRRYANEARSEVHEPDFVDREIEQQMRDLGPNEARSEVPLTAAGRALNANLAYDRDPEQYLPGDYFEQYQVAIAAIEAEAIAHRNAELAEAVRTEELDMRYSAERMVGFETMRTRVLALIEGETPAAERG